MINRNREAFETALLILAFGICLFFLHGCSFLKPNGNSPMVNAVSNGISGNEIHVEHSTGSVVNSSLTGVSIGTATVTTTIQAKVDKGAVQITIPVTVQPAQVKFDGSILQSIIIAVMGIVILLIICIWGWVRK